MKSDSEDIKERTESAVYVFLGEYSLCHLKREQRVQSMLSKERTERTIYVIEFGKSVASMASSIESKVSP